MKRMVLLLTAAFLLGCSTTAVVAAEPATGPSGFPDVSDSEGKTGETAECPIKKTIGGKTYCFQNDPAFSKPQGGY
jgi:hypothetical protein